MMIVGAGDGKGSKITINRPPESLPVYP